MCFIIDSLHQEEKIATEDIVCYKLLSNKNLYYMQSPVQNTKYWHRVFKRNFVIKKSKLILYDSNAIEVGLHSYSTYDALISHWLYQDYKSNRRIYNAVIPKGSHYYYDSVRNQYVSDTLKVFTKSIKTN